MACDLILALMTLYSQSYDTDWGLVNQVSFMTGYSSHNSVKFPAKNAHWGSWIRFVILVIH